MIPLNGTVVGAAVSRAGSVVGAVVDLARLGLALTPDDLAISGVGVAAQEVSTARELTRATTVRALCCTREPYRRATPHGH